MYCNKVNILVRKVEQVFHSLGDLLHFVCGLTIILFKDIALWYTNCKQDIIY